jgi:hypothetical protein
VAEALKRELGVEADLVEGRWGEFTVWVSGRVVARRSWLRVPPEQEILSAVRQALEA